jgi:hypothetical protein
MRRTCLALAAVAALLTPAAASAAERQIYAGEAYDVSAYRGWLMLATSNSGPVLWRGSRRAFRPRGAGASGVRSARLGSDARGRTSIVYWRCAKETDPGNRFSDCEVVSHLLAGGNERTLLRVADSLDIGAIALSQGVLAASLGYATGEGALHLVRPGERPRRLSADGANPIGFAGGRLVYVAAREFGFQNAFWVAGAIDLRSRRPRYRTLATHDGTNDDGRMSGSTITSFQGAATDGRFAYWLRSDLRERGSTFEVWRADLNDPDAVAATLRLENPASSIAVAGGRIYYTGRAAWGVRGVYEVRDPAWRPAE